MPELSRTQVAVYGAIAVALLFIGARAVRGESGGGSSSGYTSSYGSSYSSGSGAEDEAGEESGGGEEAFSVTGAGSDVVVDVTGAVRRPGVYRLPAGSRVDDALKRAGGAEGTAAVDSINLAARLADGQQVVVPEEVEGGGAAPGAAIAGAAGEEDGPISLSTATAAELDTIDGIGPVTAEDIIDFREEHGGLSSVDQLDQISGSFAAVLGILLLAAPIREWLLAHTSGGQGRDGVWRRALAEGIAVTVAATLATAPLIAYVFEELSVTSLAANVLVLPAVAPAMWLGMVAAALAQVPGLPLAPLNGLDALFLAYIAQVAAWCGRPPWAVLHVHIGLIAMLATYAGMVTAIVAGAQLGRARRLSRARATSTGAFVLMPTYDAKVRTHRWWRGVALIAVLGSLAAFGAFAFIACRSPGSDGPVAPPPGLRIEVLDVGQGDAILLQPRSAPAVLVDGGPPGDELVTKLHDEGVSRLGAAVVTHDQSDHAAGIAEALGQLPIARLVYGRLDRRFLATAQADGARPEQVAEGTTLRSGSLHLEVLWPPPTLLAEDPPETDPNALALVIRARWHRFTMLLTADAEAESTPLDPGPIDVLKVAHHGSDDAGLGELLDRIRPRLAVISVGADNSYGHPTPGTLATLAEHHVPTLRTDLDGTVEIDVRRRSFSVK